MSIEAMKRLVAAVEAIPEEVEGWMPDALTDALIDARQAIAEAEKHEVSQEPVALMVVNGEISYKSTDDDQSFGMWCPVNYDSSHSFPDGTKFYIHPQPKREPLTHEQAKALVAKYGHDPLYLVLQTEAAHGIKGDA